jgi:hypothetical protein
MHAIAAALSFLLVLIAAIHAYWALGGLWPAATERELIDTVVGNASMTQMPPAGMALTVAALILAAAIIPVALTGAVGLAPVWLVRLAAVGAGLVFSARGVAGYFFSVVAWTPVEPFASLNRLYYSPLCLVIGAIFFILLLMPVNSNEGFTQ